jgi:hypothetical protein
MLSTLNVSNQIQDIPTSWIFQNYCKLNEQLTGQEVKITSVFKPNERTPSMIIYCTPEKKYRFNDFSTGLKGDGIDLVKYMFNLDNRTSTMRILNDYSQYIITGAPIPDIQFEPVSKYKVMDAVVRQWNNDDVRFWTSFHIGSKMLAHYNVKPLHSYNMVRTGENGPEMLEITKPYLYGYYKKDGTLYKVYQPYNKERKFLKVINGYIQGDEQRTKKNPYLMWTSSLKDTMCIRSLGIKKIDFESPDSENNRFDVAHVENRREQYRKIFCLFDSDDTGVKMMKEYKKEYDIDFIFYNKAKDPSDGVKKFGPMPVRNDLVIKINSKLNAIL